MAPPSDQEIDGPAFTSPLESDVLPPPPSVAKRVWSFVRRQPLGTAGLLMVITFILMAAFASSVTAFDPEASGRAPHPGDACAVGVALQYLDLHRRAGVAPPSRLER